MTYRFAHLEKKAERLHEVLTTNSQINLYFDVQRFQRFATFCSMIYKDEMEDKANKIVIYANDDNYKIILYDWKCRVLLVNEVVDVLNICNLLIFLRQSHPSLQN
jgi:hypothetical protein